MASPSPSSAGKLVLEPNVPQTIALKYPTGKICESRYSEEKQVYFSLVDGRGAYFSLGLAQSITSLMLGTREEFLICKRWNGSKQQAPKYDVWRNSGAETGCLACLEACSPGGSSAGSGNGAGQTYRTDQRSQRAGGRLCRGLGPGTNDVPGPGEAGGSARDSLERVYSAGQRGILMARNSQTWTIYVLRDPRNNAVRYVGATFQILARRRAHERDCEVARRPLKAWLIELGGAALIPTLEVLETGQGKPAEAERRWITTFRENGSDLTNATVGGPGRAGRKVSPEEKRKKAESQTGQKRSAEFRERMRALSKNRPPEFWVALAALNRANNSRPQSAESRAKMSAAKRGKPWTPARRAAQSRKGGF